MGVRTLAETKMASRTATGARTSPLSVAPDILDARERLEFEHLLQWLRLSLLITPLLVLVAFGPPALSYAIWIAVAILASFSWVALLAVYRPHILLRTQLWLRLLDCALVYGLLVNYHAYLQNAYYDAVYSIFVVAAAATHGRRGALILSVVAAMAVFIGRVELIASGALALEVRHLTDSVFYGLFFLVTSSAVAFLMHKSADVVTRRERSWHAAMSVRNAELERATRELAQSIHLRDAMLTGVTHDLRTPLTVIKVQAQLLRRRADDQIELSVTEVERAATRMSRWIDELLEVATMRSAEEMPLVLEPTDLVQLTSDVLEEHRQSARRHEFRLDRDAPELTALVDAARLQRVLENIVGNAVKYSPNGGCISVDVSSDDAAAIIVVRDEGVGIPADDLPYIFEPFRRGANVVGRISGTGIGLASADRIVRAHGGSMSVASAPGNGTAFTIRLPLAPPAEDN